MEKQNILKKYWPVITAIAVVLVGLLFVTRNVMADNSLQAKKATMSADTFGVSKNLLKIEKKPSGATVTATGGTNTWTNINGDPYRGHTKIDGSRCTVYDEGEPHNCPDPYDNTSSLSMDEYWSTMNAHLITTYDWMPASATTVKVASADKATATVKFTYSNVGTYNGDPVGCILTIKPMETGGDDAYYQVTNRLYEGIWIRGGDIKLTYQFFKTSNPSEIINLNGETYFTIGSFNYYGPNDYEWLYFDDTQKSNITGVYFTENTAMTIDNYDSTHEGVHATDEDWTDYIGGDDFERAAATFKVAGTSYGFYRTDGWMQLYSATISGEEPPAPKKYVVNKSGTKAAIADYKVGDTLTYEVDQQVNTLGVDTLLLYKSFVISDTLPSQVDYVDAKLYKGNTEVNSSWYSISVSGRTVTCTWTRKDSSRYLKGMDMDGETYTLRIQATVNSSATTSFENSAKVTINGDEQSSNIVTVKIPATVTYHVLPGTNIPQEIQNIQPSAPNPDTTHYVGDSYTAKDILRQNPAQGKDYQCTFNGWYANNTLSGNKYTSGTLTGDLDLYGRWSCTDLINEPTKTVNKTQIKNDEQFVYSITYNVPAITDSNYYYSSYQVTDQIEPVLRIVDVSVTRDDNTDVTNKYTITTTNNLVKAVLNNVNDSSFYNHTYTYKIKVSKIPKADLTPYLSNNEYIIPNKATVKINDKSKETPTVNVKVKKATIKYHVIGDVMPPADQTDPTPADETVYTGSAYNQKNKLTTRYVTKKCTFNGWYTNEEFTTRWTNGDAVDDDLDFYGSWQCDGVINSINKATDEAKIVGTLEYDYVITQTVPELTESFFYKKYEVTDQLEPVLEMKDTSKVKVLVGTTNVTDKFNVTIENNKVSITAKNTATQDFYNKDYTFILTVNKKQDADLTPYKQGDKYIIPNKADLDITPADNTPVKKTTRTVYKEVEQVTIDYQIIGDTTPPADQTDPTPGSTTIIAGTKYKSENPLTTRYNLKKCTFKGWYQDRNMQTKYQDNTEVLEDMTLYGSWDCSEIVKVPPTAAFKSKIVIALGVLLVAVSALAFYAIARKKKA